MTLKKQLRQSIAAATGKNGRDKLHQVLIAPAGPVRDSQINEYADTLAEKGLVEKGNFKLPVGLDVKNFSIYDMFAENPDIVYTVEAPEKEWNDDALANRMLLAINIRDAVIIVTGTKENVDRLFETYPELKNALPAPIDISQPITAEEIAEEKRERISAEWQSAKAVLTGATGKPLIAPETATFKKSRLKF